MTFVTWLVLLTALDPAPTFIKVDEFPTQQTCERALEEFIKESSIDERKAKRFGCITVVTGKLKDA